jgi:hypothetical protein
VSADINGLETVTVKCQAGHQMALENLPLCADSDHLTDTLRKAGVSGEGRVTGVTPGRDDVRLFDWDTWRIGVAARVVEDRDHD